METLATNLEKAALVRFLTIEYVSDNKNNNSRRVTTYLSKSLINMHTLSDFRIRSPPINVEVQMIKGLGEILWSFSITNFLLQRRSQHISSQTELQILGLYTPGNPRNLLKTLKELHNARLFLPIVLTLDCKDFTLLPSHIGIFPTFYSVDRRATIPQVLAQSFCKDQSNSYMAVTELTIYLIDSSDISSIYALAKDMVVSFSQIGRLNLWFEHRYKIPTQEIKEEFSFLTNLPGGPGLHLLAQGMMEMQIRAFLKTGKMAHAKEWEVACPELIPLTHI